MNDPFELASLEEIEQMEKQRSKAIESLQISNGLVKCQQCGMAVPLLRTLTKPKSNRIDALEKQIKWIENHSRSNSKDDIKIKQIKQELAERLEEDAKADKLRSLPLYSCKITAFKFVCSTCYDEI